MSEKTNKSSEYATKIHALHTLVDSLRIEHKSLDKPANEILVEHYKVLHQAKEFHTYKDWLLKGYRVRKHEKGNAVFSKPIESEQTTKKYFRIAYIFADTQVEKA